MLDTMVSVREFSGLLGSRRDAKLPWLAQSAAAAAAAERARRAINFLAAHGPCRATALLYTYGAGF